jgi:SAM-dependent methyltransferase
VRSPTMMRLSEDDGASSTRHAGEARELARRGPAPTSAGTGPLRRFTRRIVLQLLRPFAAHQQELDGRLLDAIEDLERRLGGLERLQLEALAEDLPAALESLRARVAAGEDVIAGSRALPYTAPGALEEFRDSFAGVVLGYRNGGGTGGTYPEFEDVFRGPEERVAERQGVFVELLQGHEPVLDAGCGRGELLDLLRARGTSYKAVDADAGMVERCRAKGHDEVELATATEYLERLPDDGLGSVFSAQVLEHMPYPELRQFLALSFAKLRPGGIFVAETVNPHAPHALKTFWVDPTHRHPLFPEAALVLCRLAGFESAYVFHPLGTGHVADDRYREGEYAVVATKA